MGKQIRLLASVELCNLFGLNEALHSKDKKKKRRLIGLAGVFALLIVILLFYVGGLTYLYIIMGLADIVPLYLAVITSLCILLFTMFKAGDVLFNLKKYESIIVLPVRPAAIVTSRFLTMYVWNAALSLLVLLPGTVVYGCLMAPAPSFYIMMLLGTLILPLLPMTVATALGAIIYAISARMRHKNIVVIALSMLMVLAILAAPLLLSLGGEDITDVQVVTLSAQLFAQMGRLFPPAILFADSVASGQFGGYALLCVLSLTGFGLFAVLVGWKFQSICAAMHSHVAHRHYVMQQQRRSSPLKALYLTSLRRYVSSSIYVLNTGIGYVLMLAFSVVVLVMGTERLNALLPLEGAASLIAPIALAALCVISPTTSCALSIEGKQWWITQSLPISAKTVFDSKILVNLTPALPCYAVSEILLLIALRPGVVDALVMLLFPLVYILFSAVIGLRVNVRSPMFDWESETVVVKQSRSTMLALFIGFAAILVPVVLVFALPAAWRPLALPAVGALLLGITAAVYRANTHVRLESIS